MSVTNKNRSFALGVALTIVWVAGALALFLCSPTSAAPTKLNEWGDFFAGVSAPIAFLWLVLGYLQQGQELKLSTEALRLQADELRHSVEQQRQLVEVTRLQVDSEREAFREQLAIRHEATQPKFAIGGTRAHAEQDGEIRYTASVENVGTSATDVTFSFEPPMKQEAPDPWRTFSRGSLGAFEFTYPTGGQA